jgi:hypothetical protein
LHLLEPSAPSKTTTKFSVSSIKRKARLSPLPHHYQTIPVDSQQKKINLFFLSSFLLAKENAPHLHHTGEVNKFLSDLKRLLPH